MRRATPTGDTMAVFSGLRLDDGRRLGEVLTPFEWADAEAFLVGTGPRRHFQLRSKGYRKTLTAAANGIAALLTQLPPGSTGFAAASDADQAGLLRESIRAFVVNTPGLDSELRVEARRVVAVNRGAELVILPADSSGSHGLRPSLLVVDEVANWPDTPRHREFFDALWAGLAKVPGSRGLLITTPGSPSHFAKAIYDRAKAEDGGLWRLSEVHGPPPWIPVEEVEAERRRLVPSTFARLWLGEWAQGEDQLVDPADLDACMVLDGPIAPVPSIRYVAAIDLGTKIDSTAVVIAHAVRSEAGTRVIVDRMATWKPRPGSPVRLEDVEAWLVEFGRAYRAKLLYDPSQMYLMAERLRRAGLGCVEFTFSSASVGKIATALVNVLRSRSIELPRDAGLRDELLAVRLRETAPNVLRLDHLSGRHDDQAVACAMACYWLTSTPPSAFSEYMTRLMAQQSGEPVEGQPSIDAQTHIPALLPGLRPRGDSSGGWGAPLGGWGR